MRATRLISAPLAAAILLLCAPAAAAPRPQQPQPICFPGVPGIDDCVAPAFAAYWRGNGGLPVFGYPIGPVGPYAPAGAAAPLDAQWVERNRLEAHPANPAPYNVQIGRVGAERLEQLGRDHWADGGEPGPLPGCLWFEETRHNVCDQAPGLGFRSYWEANGLRIPGMSRYAQSLALFGLPLTAANPEPGPDGTLIVTQWFERARFEWHPDNPDQYKVLLGLLGREVRDGLPASSTGPASGAPRQVIGVEVNRGAVGAVAGRLAELRPGWVRYNGVLWDEVEPRRGERRWEALAGVEADLAAISATGAEPMLIVRRAPGWAQEVAGKPCGPIRASALPDFAAFMGELVARYSQPPYNVKHWELGNEPDAPFDLLSGSEPFGCWGDSRQPDYNGDAYAAMLKAVYPAIKAADPEAQVVFGGLLLECDPELAGQAKPCGMGGFLEGVLAAGGGDYFDMLAYHSYTYWGPVTSDWDVGFPPWAHRGGALRGKADFLKGVMRRYGISKPLIMNEGGLLCYRSDPACGPGGFYEAQANLAARLYTRAIADGLAGAIWYTLDGPGWQDGGLLDAAQQPRPAYEATRFIAGLLGDAVFVDASRDGALESYRFRKGDAMYQIVWTNDGSTRELPLPPGTRAMYTVRGETRPAPSALVAGFEPVIVEAAAP
jgi:hypothetical protein